MCTVTVIPGPPVRLACNRDESLTRPPARPPQVRRFGTRLAALPVDPESGGTWVAVSDAGLAMALLNVNPGPAGPRRFARSRGEIIPMLLACDNLADATRRVTRADADDFAPFRLVLAGRREAVEVWSGGNGFRTVRLLPLTAPLFFTSSGLGDAVVHWPRRRLFERAFSGTEDRRGRQDAFHRRRCPGRPHFGVCMSRPDSRTVSHTVIELGGRTATLTYHPDAPDRPATPVTVRLELRRDEP